MVKNDQGCVIEDLFVNRPEEDYVGLFGRVGQGGAVQNVGVVNATVAGNEYVGGLLGECTGTVSKSYSTGRVTGNTHVGGLVGHNYFGTGEGTVSNCFWDTQTSGQATSDGGTGKTTAEMKSIATFTTWDIVAVALGETNPVYIWNIVNGLTYPFLSWEP